MAKDMKRSTRLADTEAVGGRNMRAEDLERERHRVKEELEALMAQYARVSGRPELAARRFKVGNAPNDYRFEKKRDKKR